MKSLTIQLKINEQRGSVAHRHEQDEWQTEVSEDMASMHPLRILIVEDNLVNQMVATKMLSRLGYLVDIASNGLEAIDAVQRQQYDLLLMDIQMPRMNGLEATRKIRQMPLHQLPRIIAMSAAAMFEDQEAASQAGMDGFIVKPITLYELAEVLKYEYSYIQHERVAMMDLS